jgi:hypothetical protein
LPILEHAESTKDEQQPRLITGRGRTHLGMRSVNVDTRGHTRTNGFQIAIQCRLAQLILLFLRGHRNYPRDVQQVRRAPSPAALFSARGGAHVPVVGALLSHGLSRAKRRYPVPVKRHRGEPGHTRDRHTRVKRLNHLEHDLRVDRLERHVLGAAPAVAFPGDHCRR